MTAPAPAPAPASSVMLLLRRRPTALTWALLVAATVLTTWVLSAHGVDRHVSSVAIFAVVVWKVRLVMTDFMELRDAPLVGRVVFEGWAVLLPLALVVLTWP